MSDHGRRASEAKMRAAGLPEAAIAAFDRAYRALDSGESGLLRDAEIEPLTDLPALDDLPAAAGEALATTAVVKLNGGLATSMGLSGPKSLIPALGARTFLDVIAGQAAAARETLGVRLPVVLMNSFATRDATLAAIAHDHPGLSAGLPADFLQSRIPKLREDDLEPVDWPADPALEWCPPGHGDVYGALARSGLLHALLDGGYEIAMISNADNLAAVPDPRIAAWMKRDSIPFVSEQVRRTAADRKGGHLARRRGDGRLVLRETAQTPPEERARLERHPFAHANTVWIELRALRQVLDDHGGVLELPLVVNRKTVDPADDSTPAVIQLESAMGAAIAAFDGARALHVPRSRFAPVKTTDDLLVLRSDAYELSPGFVPLPAGATIPFVELDPRHFRLLRDLEARFPAGPPSLAGCEHLEVHGDVTFGADVVVRGRVSIDGPAHVADGAVLEGR